MICAQQLPALLLHTGTLSRGPRRTTDPHNPGRTSVSPCPHRTGSAESLFPSPVQLKEEGASSSWDRGAGTRPRRAGDGDGRPAAPASARRVPVIICKGTMQERKCDCGLGTPVLGNHLCKLSSLGRSHVFCEMGTVTLPSQPSGALA